MHYNYMGYWPSVRSRRLDIGMRPIFNHLDQTSLVNKGFITGIWDKTPQNDLWSCGTKQEIPSGQYSSILPTHQASHIISFLTVKFIWCPPTNYSIRKLIMWQALWAGKMNQITHCDWLPERARWSYTAHSGFLAWSHKIKDHFLVF